MDWNTHTKEQLEQLLSKVPVFLRELAKEKVSQKAESLAQEQKRQEIIEADLVNAFFDETPFGFHGPLKVDMEEIGIDYTQYGYEK